MTPSVGVLAVSTMDCGLIAANEHTFASETGGLTFAHPDTLTFKWFVGWCHTCFGPGILFPQTGGESTVPGRILVTSQSPIPPGPSWEEAGVAALLDYFLTTPLPDDAVLLKDFLDSLRSVRPLNGLLPKVLPDVLLVPIGRVNTPDELTAPGQGWRFKNAFLPIKLVRLRTFLQKFKPSTKVYIIFPDLAHEPQVDEFDWGAGPQPEVWTASTAAELANCVARAWAEALGRGLGSAAFTADISKRQKERRGILEALAGLSIKPPKPPKPAPFVNRPTPVGQIPVNSPLQAPSDPRGAAMRSLLLGALVVGVALVVAVGVLL